MPLEFLLSLIQGGVAFMDVLTTSRSNLSPLQNIKLWNTVSIQMETWIMLQEWFEKICYNLVLIVRI